MTRLERRATVGITMALMLFSACATGPRVYEKPGADPATAEGDRLECSKVAISDSGGRVVPEFVRFDRQQFNVCMQRRGYTRSADRPGF